MSPSSGDLLRVMIVEPWMGGSHEAFWDAWATRSAHCVETVGLPARHWKWRMRAGAWELARRLRDYPIPELLVVSDYLDLPAFHGFLPDGWSRVPSILFFHENQLTYPGGSDPIDPERDLHFGFTNVLSCLRASRVVFNSGFHLRDFERAALEVLATLPRPNPRAELEEALRSAKVIPPGVETGVVPIGPGAPEGAPLRVLFNHRWEHDKDPAAFLRAVIEARRRGARLELVLLGESFESVPEGTADALETLEGVILHRGFLSSRAEYVERLAGCDLVVSTARHEFFGISVLEAMSAGVTPLLPNRLSYPELVGETLAGDALYRDEKELVDRLVSCAREPEALRESRRRGSMREVAERWSIDSTTATLDRLCEEVVAGIPDLGRDTRGPATTMPR